jgi:hypothetical protein
MDAREAEQVRGPWAALVSVVIIVAGIAAWEIYTKRKAAR